GPVGKRDTVTVRRSWRARWYAPCSGNGADNANPPMRSLSMSTLLKSALTATAILSLAATGCVKQDGPPEELARAIPTAEQVRIKLPSAQARALGDLANYYV